MPWPIRKHLPCILILRGRRLSASYPYAPTSQPQFSSFSGGYPPHTRSCCSIRRTSRRAPGLSYPAQMAHPAFHAWQPQPVAVDAYGRPQQFVPPYPGYPMHGQQAAAAGYPREFQPGYAAAPEARPAATSDSSQAREMSPIEEVRESLREFRDAIRDLTESRARRSF